jgi:hypothetical protein
MKHWLKALASDKGSGIIIISISGELDNLVPSTAKLFNLEFKSEGLH